MNPDSIILHTVMRRVRTIHLVRTLMPGVLAAGFFVAALWGIGREVWVAKVLENMPSVWNLPKVLGFAASAFLHTEFLVQVFLIVAVAAIVWAARSFARALHSAQPLIA